MELGAEESEGEKLTVGTIDGSGDNVGTNVGGKVEGGACEGGGEGALVVVLFVELALVVAFAFAFIALKLVFVGLVVFVSFPRISCCVSASVSNSRGLAVGEKEGTRSVELLSLVVKFVISCSSTATVPLLLAFKPSPEAVVVSVLFGKS